MSLPHRAPSPTRNRWSPYKAAVFAALCGPAIWIAARGVMRLEPWWVALLGVVAAALTALGEALYYSLKAHAPMARVLAANLDLDFASLPPAAVVFAGGRWP